MAAEKIVAQHIYILLNKRSICHSNSYFGALISTTINNAALTHPVVDFFFGLGLLQFSLELQTGGLANNHHLARGEVTY